MRRLLLLLPWRARVALLALGAVAAIVAAGLVTPQSRELLASFDRGNVQASDYAVADIPPSMLAHYLQAADTCPDLTWQLLAGIGKVETNHGRSTLPGVTEGLNQAGCCAGPMQFNLVNGPPSTWQSFGRDFNGDGKANPHDPGDAVPAAADKLCANGLEPTPDNEKWKGVPGADPCPDVRGTPAQHRALRRYNNACWYAHQVLSHTADYTRHRTAAERASDPFVQALTDHPNLTTTSDRGCDPAPDLASGDLDVRVTSLLSVIAADYQIRISCAKSGHSQYVKGTTRVSNHYVWRAIDINQVNGQPVNASNPAAKALVSWLNQIDGPLRPSEVGSPWRFASPMYFSDEGHQGHIHIGYSG